MKIVGIYLAAGNSSRFGSKNKLMAPFLNMPLGSVGLTAAIQSRLDKIIIVTKKDDPLHWISEEVKASKERWIVEECAKAFKGQSYSLKCGLITAKKLGANAVVVILADQPFITPKLIDKLIHQFYENREVSFVGTTFNDIISPPVLLSSKMFPKIDKLTGDKGASKVIHEEKENGYLFKLNRAKALLDIDTKEDYANLKASYEKKESTERFHE